MKKLFFFSMALAMLSLASCKNKQNDPDQPAQPTTKEVTEMSGTLLFYVTAAADKYCDFSIQSSTDGDTYTSLPLSDFTKRAFSSDNAMDRDMYWILPTLYKSEWTVCYQSNQPITLKKDQKAYYTVKLDRNTVPVTEEKDMKLYFGAGLNFYNSSLGDLPAYTVEYFNSADKATQLCVSGLVSSVWSEANVDTIMNDLKTKKNPNFYILFHGYTVTE